MIHPTDLVENQTVKAQRHLLMNCRTRESAVTPPSQRTNSRKGMDLTRRYTLQSLLHNDSASMDCDNDEKAKVQNTKSQTEAALGATFEILFGKKHPDVKY
jgi:hypothetical protein